LRRSLFLNLYYLYLLFPPEIIAISNDRKLTGIACAELDV